MKYLKFRPESMIQKITLRRPFSSVSISSSTFRSVCFPESDIAVACRREKPPVSLPLAQGIEIAPGSGGDYSNQYIDR